MAFTIKFLDGTEKTFETLKGAHLERADLKGAYLKGADLSGADLSGADLRGAYLRGAYLERAYLRGANLERADLRGAYLYSAYLKGADLRGADLRGADLYGSDLRGADLYGADLRGADLKGRSICPAEGSFIAYKMIRTDAGPTVITIKVLRTAKRVSSYVGRKCRASKAKVVSGLDPGVVGWSSHDPGFKYELGKVVKASNFCDDPRIECAGGVHFFMERMEAESY